MPNQDIPIAHLNIQLSENTHVYSQPILENEIAGIYVEHVAITDKNETVDFSKDGYKTIYLFIKGSGSVTTADTSYDIVPETILLPNIAEKITVKAASNNTLHYLKIVAELTAQDQVDLQEFPADNTQTVYYAKFTDCQAYTEPIKSPNTISRTILPNKIIPRIAMGTVQTTGPDEVGAHEHPMLEQLFLGLTDNHCVVYADEAEVVFPQYSVLHIPLGSRHSVSVAEDEVMYYIWMDFFLDSKGEAWLETHNHTGDE